ncbi:MAG: MFS transporter [Acidobacteriaceae bacterium]
MLHWNYNYFSRNVGKEVKEVYWFASLNSLALALIFIFEPIYLYSLHYGLSRILWYYALVYFGYCLLIFPGAKLASKIGYKHSILISSVVYVAYWLTLYSVKANPSLFFVAPFLFSAQKALFWPAYNSNVALASMKFQRGREVGFLFSLTEVFSIIGPMLGGLISATLGFGALFAIASALMVAAVYPLFQSPDIHPRHNFKLANFEAILKKFPSNFFGYWGYAEDLMLMSLWPLYIFAVVPYFLGVGTIATFASLTAAVIMLYIGRVSDRLEKHRLILRNSFFYGLTWVFRVFARGPVGVVLFDVLTKTGRGLVHVPEVSLTYELAAEEGPDHAIAYAVFYEFSLAVGKVVTALAGILILLYSNDNIYLVFVLAGLMTMLYGLLKPHESKAN